MSNTNHTFHETALPAVNEALVVLGQDVSLVELSTTSTTVNSRKAAFLYEASRMKVLRDHNWNFARAETFAESCGCDCTEDGMQFRTQKPAKCVRILGCYHGREECQYRVFGSEIRSNIPVERIVYTKDIEDLNKWSPDAYRALILRIAADLAKPITGRINERQLQEEAYNAQLQSAKLADARESNIPYDAWGDNHYVKQMRGGSRPQPDWRR